MQILELGDNRARAGFEIPGFVEDVIGGQQLFACPGRFHPVVRQQGRIVQGFACSGPLFNHPEDDRDAGQLRQQFVQGLVMGGNKIRPFKQVLRWIPAQAQLRKDGKPAALCPGSL